MAAQIKGIPGGSTLMLWEKIPDKHSRENPNELLKGETHGKTKQRRQYRAHFFGGKNRNNSECLGEQSSPKTEKL